MLASHSRLTFVLAVHEPPICSLQFLFALGILALNLIHLSGLLVEQLNETFPANFLLLT